MCTPLICQPNEYMSGFTVGFVNVGIYVSTYRETHDITKSVFDIIIIVILHCVRCGVECRCYFALQMAGKWEYTLYNTINMSVFHGHAHTCTISQSHVR